MTLIPVEIVIIQDIFKHCVGQIQTSFRRSATVVGRRAQHDCSKTKK